MSSRIADFGFSISDFVSRTDYTHPQSKIYFGRFPRCPDKKHRGNGVGLLQAEFIPLLCAGLRYGAAEKHCGTAPKKRAHLPYP
jgi:hypothetical protein